MATTCARRGDAAMRHHPNRRRRARAVHEQRRAPRPPALAALGVVNAAAVAPGTERARIDPTNVARRPGAQRTVRLELLHLGDERGDGLAPRSRPGRSRRPGRWAPRRSLLMATMTFEPFMPARCWMAPEMATAMYSCGATTLPVWPTCRSFGTMPASQAARLAPSAPPSRSASSSRSLKFSPSLHAAAARDDDLRLAQLRPLALRGLHATGTRRRARRWCRASPGFDRAGRAGGRRRGERRLPHAQRRRSGTRPRRRRGRCRRRRAG